MNTTEKFKKIVVISGEKSGEMHAAKVCKELFAENHSIKIIGWGGDEMVKAGVDVRRHIDSLAIMGFWEVFKRIFFIFKLFKECKTLILETNPDAILYVDYSGFNLRMAKWSFEKGFNNYYYIAPKTWAWNNKRTNKLTKYIKKVYSILPFEVDFFKKYGVEVQYVGNPVIDTIKQQKKTPNFKELHDLESKPIVALVPGSRGSEIKSILPIMCSIVNEYPEYDFVVSGVTSVSDELYTPAYTIGLKVIKNDFYSILLVSSFALVTSGTATLETALLNVPQIVCYKTSKLSYFIGKLVIKVKFISLVNLICNDLVVEELIQDKLSKKELILSFERLIINRQKIKNKYQKIHELLAKKNASKETAKDLILQITNH